MTGGIGLLISLFRGSNTDAQRNSEEGLELSDEAWHSDHNYGYDKEKAITVKDINQYLSYLILLDGTPITWKKKDETVVSCEEYNGKSTIVTRMQIYNDGKKHDQLYFVDGCKEDTSYIPSGYKRTGTALSHEMLDDGKKSNNLLSKLKSKDSAKDSDQELKQNNGEEGSPDSVDSSNIPVKELKLLKQLHESGGLNDEEFSQKKKDLLGL